MSAPRRTELGCDLASRFPSTATARCSATSYLRRAWRRWPGQPVPAPRARTAWLRPAGASRGLKPRHACSPFSPRRCASRACSGSADRRPRARTARRRAPAAPRRRRRARTRRHSKGRARRRTSTRNFSSGSCITRKEYHISIFKNSYNPPNKNAIHVPNNTIVPSDTIFKINRSGVSCS